MDYTPPTITELGSIADFTGGKGGSVHTHGNGHGPGHTHGNGLGPGHTHGNGHGNGGGSVPKFSL